MSSNFAQGWVKDDEAVEAILPTLPYPVAGDTPAGQVEDIPDHVYLWDVARAVNGSLLPPRNQGQVGSCVSFGTARAVEYSMCAEIAVGEPESFLDLCTEVIYAGSRVEIGGGRLRGDGSVGAWAADWCRKYGILGRLEYKTEKATYDLRQYSEARCKSWGSTGVPNDLEPLAKVHPIRQTTQVKTWEEAKRMLASGYGIAVCSGQGFSMKRDERGVAKASGSWAHCMCLCGYHIEGGKEFGRIDNSWGANAHTGPVGWGNPGPEGFWADAAVINKMLGEKDSWAFSAVDGFPAKKLRWII